MKPKGLFEMFLHYSLIKLLMLSFLIYGCAEGVENKYSSMASFTESRIAGNFAFIGGCSILTENEAREPEAAPFVVGVLGAIVPALVSKSLDGISNWLVAQGQSLPIEVMDSANYTTSEINVRKPLCVHFVRGTIGTNVPDSYEPSWLPGMDDIERNRFATQVSIPLLDKPDFLLESRLRFSPDRTAVAIAPTYLYYPDYLDDSIRLVDKRALALDVKLYPAGEHRTGAASRGSTVLLGEFDRSNDAVRFPLPASPKDRFPVESTWFQVPMFLTPASQGTGTAGSSLDTTSNVPSSSPLEAAQEASAEGLPPPVSEPPDVQASVPETSAATGAPFVVDLKVVETSSGSQVAAFLGSVLGEAKPALTPVLSAAAERALIPGVEEAARLDAMTQRQSAEAIYWQKYVAAEGKYDVYCATAEGHARLSASEALRAAQGEANLEARRIGHPRPYPERVPVAAGNLWQGCAMRQ